MPPSNSSVTNGDITITKESAKELNPRSKPTEFLGPAGTTVVTFLTPLMTYLLFFGCNPTTGCPSLSLDTYKVGFQNGWPAINGKLWDWGAAGVYAAWYAFTVICWNVLPGQQVEGTVLRNGKRKMYNLNGTWTILLALAITAGICSQPGGIELYTYAYDHWLPLTSAALVNATFQAVFVYVNSFYSGELLALGGNSGVFFYDFFIGRPLNPTWPGFPNFDIKTFNEDRPGLILWPLLNISCMCEQYVKYGRVTDSMWLVVAFQLFYSADCQWFESSMLTQMDITTDGFGYMLSFGDLVWVPFTYGIQARYLAFHPVDLGLTASAAIVALNVIGFYIFRTSNSDKDSFRKHNNPKNFEYLQTERGTKLMTSGWWGRSRHPNYFGDWLMALAWCLPTGFNTPITYFYLAFFVVLLLHRQMRDDEACREKYGKDWDKYCKLVPYKIIPYVGHKSGERKGGGRGGAKCERHDDSGVKKS